MLLFIFIVLAVHLTSSKYVYKGFNEYPGILKYIVYADQEQIVLYYNKYINFHRNDSALPLVHYIDDYSGFSPTFGTVNNLYYRIGYLQRTDGGLLYQYKQNQLCTFIDQQRKFNLSNRILTDDYRTYILSDSQDLNIVRLDDNCQSQLFSLGVKIQGPWAKMHNFNLKQMLIVMDNTILVVSKDNTSILQTIKTRMPISKMYQFNLSISQKGIAQNFTIYSQTYYEIYSNIKSNQFNLIAFNQLPYYNKIVDFSQFGVINVMDTNCNIFQFNAYSNIQVQDNSKLLLGKTVGFNRVLGLFAKRNGLIIKLNLLTLQFSSFYQIQMEEGVELQSVKFIDSQNLYYINSKKDLCHYYLPESKQTKIGTDFDLIVTSENSGYLYVSGLFAIGCIEKICKIAQFFQNNTIITQGTIPVDSFSNLLLIQSFVQDTEQNSDASWYYIIFKNQLDQYQSLSLGRSRTGTWRVIRLMGIQKDYTFYNYYQQNRNTTYLAYYKQIQDGKTKVTSYNAENDDYFLNQYTNLLKIASFLNQRLVFIYKDSFLRTGSGRYLDREFDYIENINISSNMLPIDKNLIYYQINNTGKFMKITKENMRLQSTVYTLPTDYCKNLYNLSIFKYRDSVTKQSIFMNPISSNRIYALSRFNKSVGYSQRIVNLGFESINLDLKHLSYDEVSGDAFFLVDDIKQGKMHLLYQSVKNFVDHDFTWRYRYSRTKIASFSSSFSRISLIDDQSRVLIFRKNLGKVLSPKIFNGAHISAGSPFYIMNQFTSGTQIVLKSFKKNILTNQTVFTIDDPPYCLDYMGDIRLSPSGNNVLMAKYFYSQNRRLGEINKTDGYFMNDKTLIYSAYNSQCNLKGKTLLIYHIQQHPFNYSIIPLNICSENDIYFDNNKTHIAYFENDTVIIVDEFSKKKDNFSITQIGHQPFSLFLNNNGSVFMVWNTMTFRWDPVNQNDDDDDKNGGLSGLVIGAIVGGSLVIVGIGAFFIIKKIRVMKKVKQDDVTKTLITQEKMNPNEEEI